MHDQAQRQTDAKDFDLLREARLFDLKNNEKHHSFNAFVTPEVAKQIIERHNYRHQRPVTKSNFDLLFACMERGSFREYTSINFAVKNGEPILVDGQHRLSAAMAFGKPLWFSFHFHRMLDDSEVEVLYGTFDVGKKRSSRDTMGSIGDDLGLPNKERDAFGVAVTLLNLGFRPTHGRDEANRIYEAKNSEFKKSLMREWGAEASVYFDCIAGAPKINKEPFYRGSVMAVGLITLREQPDKAIDFWKGAALDDGLRVGDPRKSLINWLKSNPAGKAVNLQHRATIACWNAWFDERQLTKVYPRSGVSLEIHGSPIVIAGDGRRSSNERGEQ